MKGEVNNGKVCADRSGIINDSFWYFVNTPAPTKVEFTLDDFEPQFFSPYL